MADEKLNLREIIWVGDSKVRLKEFPQAIQKDIGDALFIAQAGNMSPETMVNQKNKQTFYPDPVGAVSQPHPC